MRTELVRELLRLKIELAREGGATAASPAAGRERFPHDAALIEAILAGADRRDRDDEGGPDLLPYTNPFDLAPGYRVGPYAILGRLDEGGEAFLYRVLH